MSRATKRLYQTVNQVFVKSLFYITLSLIITMENSPFKAVHAQDQSAQEIQVEEAIKLGLDRLELSQRLKAQISRIKAEFDDATSFPLPRLELSQESIFGDLNVQYVEQTVLLEQSFDLSGWRSALKATLAHQESALRAETADELIKITAKIRESLYQALCHQNRLEVLEAWIKRLSHALKGAKARVEQGDVSLYQTHRISRELDLARAKEGAELTAQAESWVKIERWVSWTQRPRLLGELSPSNEELIMLTREENQPKIEKLRHLKRALSVESEVWGRPFMREWSVSSGYRHAEVGSSLGHGFLVTLSLPLALWNTDTPKLRSILARQHQLNAEIDLRSGQAKRVVEAAKYRLNTAMKTLKILSPHSHDLELPRLAQLAFDAGETSLTEFLDTLKSETDLKLARIDAQWEARRAAIALDKSLGIGLSP